MIGPKGANLFKQIVKKDLYRIDKYKGNEFDYIFDIGANIGWFSLKARMKFVNAKIVSVEARDDIVKYLYKNMNMFPNVYIEHGILGNGENAYFGYRTHVLDALLVPESWPESKVVRTISIKQLFDKYGCTISDKYMLKFNCEGGEYYLKGVSESELILINAKAIGMMLHFRSTLTPFKHWPTYDECLEWFTSLFSKTHNIKVTLTNHKRGICVANARKIDL